MLCAKTSEFSLPVRPHCDAVVGRVDLAVHAPVDDKVGGGVDALPVIATRPRPINETPPLILQTVAQRRVNGQQVGDERLVACRRGVS